MLSWGDTHSWHVVFTVSPWAARRKRCHRVAVWLPMNWLMPQCQNLVESNNLTCLVWAVLLWWQVVRSPRLAWQRVIDVTLPVAVMLARSLSYAQEEVQRIAEQVESWILWRHTCLAVRWCYKGRNQPPSWWVRYVDSLARIREIAAVAVDIKEHFLMSTVRAMQCAYSRF